MKILFILMLSLSSFSALAAAPSSVDALTSFLKLGLHHGVNERGSCMVLVNEVNYPNRAVNITVIEENGEVSKLVQDGYDFRLRAYLNEFTQTTTNYIDSSRINYVEQVIRTVNTDFNKLYVVTSYTRVINREMNSDIAECIIDL